MARNVTITLTLPETRVAMEAAVMRRIASMRNGLNKNKHALKSDLQTDFEGAASEMAFAKYLGVYWEPTVNTFKAPDVGVFQVRSTSHANGHLLIRPNDHPAQTYILVIVDGRKFCIVGSVVGSLATQEKYFRAGQNGEADCWWVPQADLSDLPAATTEATA